MTTTKQVATSMTFEVTVHMTATETADDTGADISDLALECVNVDGAEFSGWFKAVRHMNDLTQKGDWDEVA